MIPTISLFMILCMFFLQFFVILIVLYFFALIVSWPLKYFWGGLKKGFNQIK